VPRWLVMKEMRFFANKSSSAACNIGGITQNGIRDPKSVMNKP
jgi:hypothetical protein